MIVPRLAFRNIIGAGMRTWLNVFVVSAAYVMIIWAQGIIAGMDRTIVRAKIDYEIAGGQYWHREYDPYDPLTFEDGRGVPPAAISSLVDRGKAEPILLAMGTIYPQRRQQAAVFCGIVPEQEILALPSDGLAADTGGSLPAVIGIQLARETGLREGSEMTIRWRDANGTFDAREVRICGVIDIGVPGVAHNTVWIPLSELQTMLGLDNASSYVVVSQGVEEPPAGNAEWVWHDQAHLLADVVELVRMKSQGSYIVYGLMLFMGLLAIFDTQVLAIWRRRREIGTLMALGMERSTVIRLFTFEGALHGVLAVVVGAVYGIPILAWTLSNGIPVPEMMNSMGMPVPQVLYPHYGPQLLLGTTALILASVTIVSAIPASRIARLKPTDAIRGKA